VPKNFIVIKNSPLKRKASPERSGFTSLPRRVLQRYNFQTWWPWRNWGFFSRTCFPNVGALTIIMAPMKRKTQPKTAAAAFYDLDGTLVKTNLVHALLFQARNQQGILRSVAKSALTLASIPLFIAIDTYSRNVFQEFFFIGRCAFSH
jgi:hypothetical protein